YGNGFPIESLNGKDILVVAGGIGIAPLRSLIQYVIDNRKNYNRFLILMGAKTPEDMLFIDELLEIRKIGVAEVHLTVDRASFNWQECVGVVTVLFKRIKIDPLNTYVFVVGPPIMFKFVLLELEELGIPPDNIYVSLERHMKCGIGKCGHCQINGFYVCREGPVFSYSQLIDVFEAFHWRR
ncbi:MAG: FAD/NAD(P)-binding protein, partial [bacterium]|nr:FAD/NAD(P)-binding protein [bacterium]